MTDKPLQETTATNWHTLHRAAMGACDDAEGAKRHGCDPSPLWARALDLERQALAALPAGLEKTAAVLAASVEALRRAR